MIKPLKILAILSLGLNSLNLYAQEVPDQPVKEGAYSVLWYDTPKNFLGAIESRRAFIKVLKLQGHWAYVELYYTERVATVMHLVSLVENDSEIGRKFLSETGTNKEEFLKKVASEPLSDQQRTKLWINLDQVEAITDLKVQTK
jgi:hypothetical protein